MKGGKLIIWVVYLQKKAIKDQGIRKNTRFEDTLETDEVGASVIKQNFSISRKKITERRLEQR